MWVINLIGAMIMLPPLLVFMVLYRVINGRKAAARLFAGVDLEEERCDG